MKIEYVSFNNPLYFLKLQIFKLATKLSTAHIFYEIFFNLSQSTNILVLL